MNFFLHKNNLLVVGFLILLSACCRIADKTTIQTTVNLSVQQDFQFDSTYNTLIIKNDKDYPITFRMKINEIFPLEMSDINNKIKQISIQKSVSTAQAAWEYISENTFWNRPYTAENWQHDPILFLNSIGGGICDDFSSVLAKLWQIQGRKSRIINLEGHVVPEVRINNQWKMYYPSFKTYYCDSSKILAVKQIEQLSKNQNSYMCADYFGINKLFLDTGFSNAIQNLYITTDNNEDVTSWHLDYNPVLNKIILPSKSKLEIHFDNNKQVAIKVKLSKESKGELQLPFIPFDARGYFQWSNNDIDYFSNEIKSKFRQIPLNKIFVKKVKEQSEIFFLVNPKLNVLNDSKNTLTIQANNSLNVHYSHSKHPFETSSMTDLGLFFESIIDREIDFYLTLKNKTTKTNLDFSDKELFVEYLKLDSSIHADDFQMIVERFDKWFPMFQHELSKLSFTYPNELRELIMCGVFVMIKYNSIQMLNYVH